MKVLFVCVHNSGRSQMAEAVFNHEAAKRGLEWRAQSAGTVAGGQLNPNAVAALQEIGAPTEELHPKQLTQEMVDLSDRVVSMGCGVDANACPARFLLTEDWGLDDPAGQPIDRVREVRDEIVRRVTEMLDSAQSAN
jgi:arsenate reductase